MSLTPEQLQDKLEKLRDPRRSLPLFGRVMHQKDDSEATYDPYAITYHLQSTILDYVGNPPRTAHGQTKWLALLGPRQEGKSTVGELAFLPKAMYTPGWDHVCIADVNFRADYLHGRVQYAHQRWPSEIRVPKVHARESRQLTLDPHYGGKMRTLSMQSGAVGLGQTPNSFHWSEVAFCRDAERQWTYVQPSMRNKDNALVLLECTPAPADEPGTEFWKDICYDAKKQKGRWIYAFFPFWDGKLNARPWPSTWTLDNDEVRLLEKYGHLGLRKENLAFRRLTFDNDPGIRRNPELFDVFYPSDDISCWINAVRGVIHPSVVKRHLDGLLIPWNEDRDPPYKEFYPPSPEAHYVIGVDPTGYGTRDHASFQVLEVWDGEWRQVAVYAFPIGDPNSFTDRLMQAGYRYNTAELVVESTGVGVGVLSLLIERGYPKIYYEAKNKPGKSAAPQNVEKMLSHLIDALQDELVLRDADTVDQLLSYQNDKLIEEGNRSERLRGGRPSRARRARHHWDKVSALIYAVYGARRAPQRFRPRADVEPENVVPFVERSYNEQRKIVKAMKPPEKKNNKLKYRRVGKRRK